jgi:hypothetical protein
MKTAVATAIVAAALFIVPGTVVVADGLIHQLPKDGSWVQFDVTGESLTPAGLVRATLKGTVTVKSVGEEKVDGIDCRWIEIESEMDARSVRGQRSWSTEDYKLLIPEKNLATGQNPRTHVLKAWTKDTRGVVTEVDLKDGKPTARGRLEELLNGGLPNPEKHAAVEIKAPGGTFRCTHTEGKEISESGDIDLAIQTWLTDEVPFGVAAYRHAKTQKREGQLLGSKWMELKFAKSGTDAKSSIDPAAKASPRANPAKGDAPPK